jgi:hypothetical protein
MISIERPEMSPHAEVTLNQLVVTSERLTGLLEYVAMMVDVELPEDEEEDDEGE